MCNIMPAFIGYALFLTACDTLGDKRSGRVRLSSALLGVISLVQTVLALLAVSLPNGLTLAITLLATAGALYVSYEIACFVKEAEQKGHRPLGGNDLNAAWFLLVLGHFVSIFLGRMESMALLCIVLQLLSIAWFQASLYRTMGKMNSNKK